MKKFFAAIVIISVIFAGCRQSNDPEIIKKKISRYRAAIERYQEKIRELEKQLPQQDVVLIPVKVETVKPRVFQHYLELTANIEPIEYAYISPQASGTVKAIYVSEGDFVQQGQLLLELDDALIKRNIAQLQVQLELADSLYRKQKTLYEQGVTSEVQYLQAKSQKEALEKNLEVLRTQLKYTKLYAPFAGVVDQINTRVGELCGPQARAIYLVNMAKMKAIAHVSENYLPNIHKGDPVEIKFPVYGDMVIKTRISNVGNLIDPVSHTFKVEAVFNNPGFKIKPNMTASMRFTTFKIKDAIVVPLNLLQKDSRGWYVFVLDKENGRYIASRRYITPGKITGNDVLVLSGIKPGDKIITEGYNLVHQGSFVKIVNN